ncbi:MAG: hypothetical protein EXQ91_00240 [Alphaproteobacteria bacterium]|nr:hypothetical protein [Alphaproteobacteria bacterium]
MNEGSQLRVDPRDARSGSAATVEPPPSIDLGSLVRALWRGKWVILLCIALAFGAVAYFVSVFSPRYVAQMVVIPTAGSPIQFAEQSSQVNSLFGLRSTRQASLFDRLTATIGSVALARQLDEHHGYLKKVFSGSWDETNRRWVAPQDWRSKLTAFTARQVNAPPWQPPTVVELAAFARSTVQIKVFEKIDGVSRISFEYPNRAFAVEFLTNVFYEAEALIRAEDQRSTAANMAFLQRRLREVTMTDMRMALIDVLANEERKIMALSSDLPYAARVVDPPQASDTPTLPNLLLFGIAALVGGAMFGAGLVVAAFLVRSALRRSPVAQG